MKIFHPLIFLLITVLFVSCFEDKTGSDINWLKRPPLTVTELYNCYKADGEWDEQRIENALLGTWEWQYIDCFWTPEQANGIAYKGMSVEFRSDSTLVVSENDSITRIITWWVEPGDGTLYGLEMEPNESLLFGRILICDNLVVFNGHYIDACDNFFNRID